jgi:SAM-dependent methyltransferase
MSMVICPLCESKDNQKKFVENGYGVLQCRNCELFFIDPYPTNPEARHSKVQEYTFDDIIITGAKDQYAAEVEYYNDSFDSIAKHCWGAKNLLDIGCGTGRLLELLRGSGIIGEGVELNKERATTARSRSGCTIYQVPVEKLHTDKKYDIITMINVLSHIPSLPHFFEAIDRLLSEQGKLVLIAGEMRNDVKQGDIIGWGIPDHMHFLGFTTIQYICKRFGYRILEHERTPYSAAFFSQARFRAPSRNRVKTIYHLHCVSLDGDMI